MLYLLKRKRMTIFGLPGIYLLPLYDDPFRQFSKKPHFFFFFVALCTSDILHDHVSVMVEFGKQSITTVVNFSIYVPFSTIRDTKSIVSYT